LPQENANETPPPRPAALRAPRTLPLERRRALCPRTGRPVRPQRLRRALRDRPPHPRAGGRAAAAVGDHARVVRRLPRRDPARERARVAPLRAARDPGSRADVRGARPCARCARRRRRAPRAGRPRVGLRSGARRSTHCRRSADRGPPVRAAPDRLLAAADLPLGGRPRSLGNPCRPLRALQPARPLRVGRGRAVALGRDRRLPPARASGDLEDAALPEGRGGSARLPPLTAAGLHGRPGGRRPGAQPSPADRSAPRTRRPCGSP
jgi:hypothetical protein